MWRIAPHGEKRETVLAVHGNADGYWYIGAGRSIAEGPYRNPDQLLSVASDLLAAETHWRIDVFDVAGNKISAIAARIERRGPAPAALAESMESLAHGSAH